MNMIMLNIGKDKIIDLYWCKFFCPARFRGITTLRQKGYTKAYAAYINYPVIILDEPLRFLSVDLQERASIMIKEISKKLGLQFLIVTHESTLASYADKVFETSIRKGITYIK